MNLLESNWIPVRQAGGEIFHISPLQVGESDWTEVISPRPDFRGALFQFLIGLLQTAYQPQDFEEWQDRWGMPPDAEVLSAAFAPYKDAFYLKNHGPAFMQDLQLPDEAHRLSVLDLLIDAGSTNNLYFNKPPADYGLCDSCVAQALFTLQLNAPAGGRGTRTSLRGGGPLTTLVLPVNDCTLWQKLWLNVLPRDVLGYPSVDRRSDVMPWLAPTRASDAQGVGDTSPETVHPLQAYWGMPRRIRLDDCSLPHGDCSICGVRQVPLTRHYRTRHGGTNYTGAWVHPLTPYSLDPKGQNPPLPAKGQRGGIGYRDWLGLTLGNDDKQPEAALVVRHYMRRIRRPRVRLWAFGFDMDNMKARCWYDSTLPVHAVSSELLNSFVRSVKLLLDSANACSSALHKQVKAAWFRRPGDSAQEPAIPQSFWQKSESLFYQALEQLSALDYEREAELAAVYKLWVLGVWRIALQLFDEWVVNVPIESMEMQRVVKARAALAKELNSGKEMKQLWALVNLHHRRTHETETAHSE